MKVLLQEIREKRKLSLKEVSVLTGIEEKMLSDIEDGYIPMVHVLVNILDGLGIEFEDLIEP